ncbi:MAG TPA: hypothetical protein VGF97_19310 [Rhizomicrobium sp.]
MDHYTYVGNDPVDKTDPSGMIDPNIPLTQDEEEHYNTDNPIDADQLAFLSRLSAITQRKQGWSQESRL